MNIGDLVRVKTKHYGVQLAVIVEKYYGYSGMEWVVKPLDHPRNVVCCATDLEVISETR